MAFEPNEMIGGAPQSVDESQRSVALWLGGGDRLLWSLQKSRFTTSSHLIASLLSKY